MTAIDIEFICTGNQCRSVMAEGFARRIADRRGLAVSVASSGILPPGNPAPDEVVRVMAARGIDVSAHRSRPFDAAIVADADLILGMERRHVTGIIAIDPDAYRRTFTLPEFLRRLDGLDLGDGPGPDLAGVLAAIGETRGRREVLRIPVDDEIDDPMGRPMKVFERTADLIAEQVDRLLGALWPDPVVTA